MEKTPTRKPAGEQLPKFPTVINFCLLCLGFFLLASSSMRAALIPYYRMDSLVLLADTVVLCEEQAIVTPPARHGKESEDATRVRCKGRADVPGRAHAGSRV